MYSNKRATYVPGVNLNIKIDKESQVLLDKYALKLSSEMRFGLSLEQALNRLIKITLGGFDNGNTD